MPSISSIPRPLKEEERTFPLPFILQNLLSASPSSLFTHWSCLPTARISRRTPWWQPKKPRHQEFVSSQSVLERRKSLLFRLNPAVENISGTKPANSRVRDLTRRDFGRS